MENDGKNICSFRVFDWVLFLYLAVCTVVGTTVMFQHFHAKSKKSPHEHDTTLALTSHSCSRAIRPRTIREYNNVITLVLVLLKFEIG